MAPKFDHEDGVVTESKTLAKVKRPSLYKVLMHNDHFTTREFVVEVLRSIFHHSDVNAHRIMLKVHHQGVGVAGIYPFEIAEMKSRKAEDAAREHEFPLKLTIEPEDE